VAFVVEQRVAVGLAARPAHSSARRMRWLGAAAGLVLFGTLLAATDLRPVLAGCWHVGPAFLLIVVAPVVGLSLHTAGWWVLLPPRVRLAPGRAFQAYVAAQTVDEIALGVAGEPLKVLALPPDGRDRGLGALLTDNLTQLLANGLFLFGGAGVLWLALPAGGVLGRAAARAGLLVLAGLASVALAWLWLRRRQPSGRPRPEASVGRLGRLGDRLRRALGEALAGVRRDPLRFAASAGLHLLGKAWVVVELGIALRALGLDLGIEALALSVGASLGALAGTPIPAGLGALEASYGLAARLVGMSLGAAGSVALLRRARSLAWAALGLAWARGIVDAAGPGTKEPG
jgi:hypothetical protein